MNLSQRFRINEPAVIAEVIDGEAVIVNLDSGAYYSLRDAGCAIWSRVAAGMALNEAAAALAGEYAASEAVIQGAVHDLAAQLQAEQLLVPLDAAAPAPLPAPARQSVGQRLQFQAPVLEKFTDMADLLLLDPIHEVEEQGWPHAAGPLGSARA